MTNSSARYLRIQTIRLCAWYTLIGLKSAMIRDPNICDSIFV